ncbi:3-isopropylmalate dehydratase small subunit [Gloeocapsa sp. PCC 73106]|uniref:3-isopropylmalate dehydratase small subunit n=1 Tax=Gloeocapsa sp. PCC 73106 TaxID=102232 RepID=UPI0002ABD30F|nr:3-isopropylmalate dehydratase small subunit [Gloeocapsa sp. PCC 73106]ELR97136.1 3-isopropylmalate dehydratase, small subunit [Gloeocapsa sp. PCC 73106]
MSEIKIIAGRGIPLTGDDIDTDRIIPARFLRCVTFDGLGEQVFKDDRQGKHPFDLPQYQGANILVVNSNFGCGSSREHAPQALAKWGIQAIIGESFAEIFQGNCLAMGLPCVTASPEIIKQLQKVIEKAPSQTLELNIATNQVTTKDLTLPVQINPGNQQMLLTGKWDSCGQLVSDLEAIQTTAAKLPYMAWAN